MHIELRKWQDAYLSAISDIFTLCNRSFLTDALPLPYTRTHAEGWFNRVVQQRDGVAGLYRIIFADGYPAGIISIDCKPGCFSCDAEISYILLDEFKGQGIMTRVVELICAEAFSSLNIHRISASVFAPNIASQRVLEKNGFNPEGRMPRAAIKNGTIYDMLLYGKMK